MAKKDLIPKADIEFNDFQAVLVAAVTLNLVAGKYPQRS